MLWEMTEGHSYADAVAIFHEFPFNPSFALNPLVPKVRKINIIILYKYHAYYKLSRLLLASFVKGMADFDTHYCEL